MAEANPNALGAPTEGLAQNVTFQFQTPGAPPQVQAQRNQNIRANVYGGGSPGQTRASGISEGPADPTLSLLMKIGEQIAKPMVEKKRTEAFFSGMQRAMEGEAIQDIAATSPWWANIFGDSDSIEGARAYLGQSKAQEAAATMDDQMPELRKMGSAEAKTFFMETVNSKLTGDKATDGAILRGMTSAMPAMMRRQSKEHYAWKQERASASESAAFNSGAENLRKSMVSDKDTPEQKELAQLMWVKAQVPAEGRDEGNWQDRTTADLIGLAKTGNLHALLAAQKKLPDSDMSLMDTLKPEQRNRVLSAQDAAENQARLHYSFEWSTDRAQIAAEAVKPLPNQTAKDIENQVDALNNRYMQASGSTRGLISPSERAGLARQSAVAITHAHEQEAKAIGKQEAELVKAGREADAAAYRGTKIKEAILTGQVYTLKFEKGFTDDELNGHAFDLYTKGADGKTPTPDQQAAGLINSFSHNVEFAKIKNSLVGQVNSAARSASPDAFKAQHTKWQAMNAANPQMAAYYFGEHADGMVRYDQGMQESGGDHAHAFFSFANKPPSKAFTEKEGKVVESVIRGMKDDYLPGMLGGDKVRPETVRLIQQTHGAAIERGTAGLYGDIATATKNALRNDQKLEIVGGFAWPRNTRGTDLTKYLTSSANAPVGADGAVAIPTDKVGDVVRMAFQHRIDEAAAGQGSNWVTVIPRGDVNGVPQYTLFVAREDGRADALSIGADEIFGRYAAKRKIDNDPTKYQFGSKITYTKDPDGPANPWSKKRVPK